MSTSTASPSLLCSIGNRLASGPFKKSCDTVHPATGAETAGCWLASLFCSTGNRLASGQPAVSAPVAGTNSDGEAVFVDIHKAFGAKQLAKMLALGDSHNDKLRMVNRADTAQLLTGALQSPHVVIGGEAPDGVTGDEAVMEALRSTATSSEGLAALVREARGECRATCGREEARGCAWMDTEEASRAKAVGNEGVGEEGGRPPACSSGCSYHERSVYRVMDAQKDNEREGQLKHSGSTRVYVKRSSDETASNGQGTCQCFRAGPPQHLHLICQALETGLSRCWH
eukprot:SM000036S13347  [mRNA]  locus=s36:717902:722405:+ [translate_table: standard]